MKSKAGTALITLGILSMILALSLLAYNRWDNWRAGQCVAGVQDALEEEKSLNRGISSAGKSGESLDGFMPSIEVDGYEYIGTLSIPQFGLELPVMSEWSYSGMKTAPGRYTGSVWNDDMVICGHNYERHFGNLRDIKAKDEVTFTDVQGNVFEYEVKEVLILEASDVDEMVTGDWDLTLFTCTFGGQSRVTVRCERTKEGETF